MRFLAEKTDGGRKKGKLSLYCRVLEISRQGFYQYLARRGRPWKYQGLADAMRAILDEDIRLRPYMLIEKILIREGKRGRTESGNRKWRFSTALLARLIYKKLCHGTSLTMING